MLTRSNTNLPNPLDFPDLLNKTSKKLKVDNSVIVKEKIVDFKNLEINCRKLYLKNLVDILSEKELLNLNWQITPKLKGDIISKLPNEVITYLFSFVSAKDLLTCCSVSKKWNNFS